MNFAMKLEQNRIYFGAKLQKSKAQLRAKCKDNCTVAAKLLIWAVQNHFFAHFMIWEVETGPK